MNPFITRMEMGWCGNKSIEKTGGVLREKMKPEKRQTHKTVKGSDPLGNATVGPTKMKGKTYERNTGRILLVDDVDTSHPQPFFRVLLRTCYG